MHIFSKATALFFLTLPTYGSVFENPYTFIQLVTDLSESIDRLTGNLT